MVKAEKPKAETRTKHPFTDKAQSERFIETARRLGIETTGKRFEEMVNNIIKQRTIS